ncbi:MAG TPA: SDR family oxidoreductase [Streptosporangiaceae bacterium]|nr:SDR family oxidoreductase [Streptosporangiaceae bacterium]
MTPLAGTSQSLAGKVALITGGSRGIGLAIARRFQREGARVATVSRSAASAASTASGASAKVLSLAGDVSSEDDVVDVMHEVERALGRLDVLVNNAAVELEARIDETSVTQWDHVMAVNVRSVFLCTKHALPLLRRAGAGSIINISSVDGFWAEPGLAAYNASKGAVLALTRAIAIDHGPEGVRCNSICPSYVVTDMLQQFFDSQPDPRDARARAESVHALRRLSTPDEVANLALWLASDESSFASGQSFVLDGGLTAGRSFGLSGPGMARFP